MTKQELIEFLEDELTIQVSVRRRTEYYSDERLEVEVKLLLKGGEEISSSVDDCSLPSTDKGDDY